MTRDEALVLLRSGQMPESRYIQVCDENGWGLGTQLLNEVGNALDDKDAEIARLRGQLVEQTAVLLSQSVTIADLMAALDRIAVGDNAVEIARAALARAQGGKE